MILIFLSLTYTSLSMVISRCIRVAANGLVSFFFMTKYRPARPAAGETQEEREFLKGPSRRLRQSRLGGGVAG